MWDAANGPYQVLVRGGESAVEKILQSPDETERSVCQRIDSDKIVFAPRLNAAHLEALLNAQTAEAIRLQQSYRSIRNLEAAIATKRQVLTGKRNVNFVSRLIGRRKPAKAGEPDSSVAVWEKAERRNSPSCGEASAISWGSNSEWFLSIREPRIILTLVRRLRSAV